MLKFSDIKKEEEMRERRKEGRKLKEEKEWSSEKIIKKRKRRGERELVKCVKVVWEEKGRQGRTYLQIPSKKRNKIVKVISKRIYD